MMPGSNPHLALPPHASAASHARYQLALEIAQRCPPALGPEILPPKIIAEATELWMFPNIIEARYALIRRGEFLALHERLVRDTHNILRVLFALNRQWEPDWKWVRHATSGLAIKPERLVDRTNEIFTLADLERCVTTCQKLIYDTLLLASREFDVGRAIRLIEESLRLHNVIE